MIFELVKKELKDYQTKLDEQSEEVVKNYYQKEHPITKKDFACAIRLFTTLVLFLEEHKEIKIKSNRNNLVNYLKASDLWSSEIYDNDDFNKNLSELKSINAQVSQVLSLYDALGKDFEPNFVNEVIEQIEKENKPENPPDEPSGNNENKNKEEEEDDIDMFAVDEEGEDDENRD